MIAIKIITIGVYGFNEISFFQSLVKAKVSIFCDIRAHRGMRGNKYGFVNSTYLQKKLSALNIEYHHLKCLAPSKVVRNIQNSSDQKRKLAKRDRCFLDEDFVIAYTREFLTNFDSEEFLKSIKISEGVVCLFCVEGEPLACHRSLVADRISRELKIRVEHLKPFNIMREKS